MGWSVSYRLVRAAPLTEVERAVVAAHAARLAEHPWPIEPYAPRAGSDGETVVSGVTKMPWSTTAPSWTWLLAALTELRALLVDARCEVTDDHDAVTWDDGRGCYTVPPITLPSPRAARPRSSRAPRAASAPRPRTWRCVRVEAHQPGSNVIVRDEDVVRFELRDRQARLQAGMFVRTAIASQIDHAVARLHAADGRELEVIDRGRWSGVELATSTVEHLATMTLEARTVTACEGFPVVRLAAQATAAPGEVALTRIEGWPRHPRVAVALRVHRIDAGLAVDCDGRDERILLQRDLTIDFIAFTAGGAELARATVTGGLADHHQVEIPLTPAEQAEVRRFDVRVTGTLVQTARLGRWQLVAGRARPSAGAA